MYAQRKQRPGQRLHQCGSSGFSKLFIVLLVAIIFGAALTGVYAIRLLSEKETLDEMAAASLLQLNRALYAYASDQEGRRQYFPPVAPYPDVWAPDLRVLYPEYLSDPDVLVSPLLLDAEQHREQLRRALAQEPPDWETAHRIAAQSILYTGYALQLEADLEHFIAAGMPRTNEDVVFEGQKLHRLRLGVERMFLPEQYLRTTNISQDVVFYVMEQPSLAQKRTPRGLYVAGHGGKSTQFFQFGSGFPSVEAMVERFPPPPM